MAKRQLNEGLLTANRISELREQPVQGQFDTAHLKEVHRRIFQDLPHHAPGDFRPDALGHFKMRELYGLRPHPPVWGMKSERSESQQIGISRYGHASSLFPGCVGMERNPYERRRVNDVWSVMLAVQKLKGD